MALLAIPFTSLSLVPHAAGGVILRGAAGYIGGTYVSAEIAQAFGLAGAALQSMGTAATAFAANPYVIGAVVLAAVAVGTYCYFHGVPAPVADTLVHAGLGVQTKKGLMISAPKLATALVLLGVAGYVTYRFYKNFKALWADEELVTGWEGDDMASARKEAERTFGEKVWSTMGEAVWATKNDVARSVVALAQEALDRVGWAADTVTSGVAAAADGSGVAVNRMRATLINIWGSVSKLKARFGRTT